VARAAPSPSRADRSDSLMEPMELPDAKKLKYRCANCSHEEEAGDRVVVHRHSLVATAQ
jgi:hypothetical protein